MGTITDNLNKLAETKSAIKTAIVNKGVAVSDSDTFASYADKIASISGGGTPTEGIYGVFIYDTNGNLTKPEEWDTANNNSAVGVAVIDENCAFVIGKTQSNNGIAWSSQLVGTTVSGIVTTENSDVTLTDYAGEHNSAIVRGLTSGETNAFNWAYSNTITANGTTLQGYLGALGEWQTAYNNKSSIDSALSKIGGTAINTDSHWTSTQYNSTDAWAFNWGNGDISSFSKSSDNYMRAFYHLDYPQINDIVSLNKYKFVYRPNQPITTGDFNHLVSLTNATYPRFENIEYNVEGTTLEYLYTRLKNNEENENNYLPVGSITINAENCSKISHLFDEYMYDVYSTDDLEIHINTSDKLTSLFELHCYTGNITISNTSKVTNFQFAFSGMASPELKGIDTSSGTYLNLILYNTSSYLIKIAYLSLKSINTTITYDYFTGPFEMPKLRYALLTDFGTGSDCTSANFGLWRVWGIENESIPLSAGARQSVIFTFITFSYDRATAGYSACTVTLSSNTKALLTQDEIAQMTAKGYTLA